MVDSASIEVNRRARRAKTDRLDSDKLLSMLMRCHAGERRVWAIARIPPPQQEDERRLHRELERLRQERTAHCNRIRSLLVLHNLRVERIGGRLWARWWGDHATQLWPGLRAEIERELERLALVLKQLRALEAQQEQQVHSGMQPMVARLARLAGIGIGSAWTQSKELFGWRQFHNRRKVAGCLGLAWSWLRFQPGSQLSRWFDERFAGGGKRLRTSASWRSRAVCRSPCGAISTMVRFRPGQGSSRAIAMQGLPEAQTAASDVQRSTCP